MLSALVFCSPIFGHSAKIPPSAPRPVVTMQKIRLGYTVAQVEKIYSRKLDFKDEIGLSQTEFKWNEFRNADQDRVSVRFFKNQLYEIRTIYEQPNKWLSIKSLTTTLSKE